MEYIAHTPTEHKRCKFIMSKGYRKGSPCGNGIGIADFDYCTEHRRVLRDRVAAVKRYAEKLGVNVVAVQ